MMEEDGFGHVYQNKPVH